MRLSRLARSTYHDDMSSTRVQTIGFVNESKLEVEIIAFYQVHQNVCDQVLCKK